MKRKDRKEPITWTGRSIDQAEPERRGVQGAGSIIQHPETGRRLEQVEAKHLICRDRKETTTSAGKSIEQKIQEEDRSRTCSSRGTEAGSRREHGR